MITADQKLVINKLNESGIPYLIVGGHAVRQYGYERYTEDINIWVNERQVQLAIGALNALDITSRPIQIGDFQHVAKAIRIANRTVDILLRCKGVSFEKAWETGTHGTIGDTPVRFISRRHLLMNKLFVHRAKDIQDIFGLFSGNQGGTVL